MMVRNNGLWYGESRNLAESKYFKLRVILYKTGFIAAHYMANTTSYSKEGWWHGHEMGTVLKDGEMKL